MQKYCRQIVGNAALLEILSQCVRTCLTSSRVIWIPCQAQRCFLRRFYQLWAFKDLIMGFIPNSDTNYCYASEETPMSSQIVLVLSFEVATDVATVCDKQMVLANPQNWVCHTEKYTKLIQTMHTFPPKRLIQWCRKESQKAAGEAPNFLGGLRRMSRALVF